MCLSQQLLDRKGGRSAVRMEVVLPCEGPNHPFRLRAHSPYSVHLVPLLSLPWLCCTFFLSQGFWGSGLRNRRFARSPGNPSIWRAQETAENRRFSQETADFRRKPQIGVRHLRCVTFSSALSLVILHVP